MYRSYLHVPHPQYRRVGTWTMRAYYDAFEVEGRAVIRGTTHDPRVWLACVRVRGRDYLVLCTAESFVIRRVREDAFVPCGAVFDTRAGHVH